VNQAGGGPARAVAGRAGEPRLGGAHDARALSNVCASRGSRDLASCEVLIRVVAVRARAVPCINVLSA
jgi:hypothetical protein